MSSNSESSVSFDSYDFDEDEEFLVLIKNLEFPAHYSDAQKERFIRKKKVNFFKKKVDPNFKPPADYLKVPQSASSSSSPPSSTTNNSSANGSAENVSSSAKSSSSSSSKSGSSSSSSQSSGGGGFKKMVKDVLNYYYLVSQYLVLVLSLLSVVFSGLHTTVLWIALFMHGIALIQNCGKPQWSQEYAQRVMQDENVMITATIGVYFMGPRSAILLAPMVLRAVFMSSYMMNGLLRKHYPQYHQLMEPTLTKVLSQSAWFNQNVAMVEVIIGIYVVIGIFFLERAMVMALLYWQILGAKYNLNYNTRSAFYVINRRIESVLGRVPAALNVYRKLTGYMYSMVDPQRLQQRQQAGGNSCCVM